MESSKTTHKQIYRNIHNYLAGRFVGATRERALFDEVIKCLFCKIFLISNKTKIKSDIDKNKLFDLYIATFKTLKSTINDIFNVDEEIQLDADSIYYFDSEINKIDILNSTIDPFGDLYEIFIGTGIREEEGQFFTPKNGIDLLVSLVNPETNEKIIAPACGAG